jgi:hypothetical protein
MNTSKNNYTKFVNEMISSDGSGMVIGYVTPGWGGHAIVGYGIAKVSENIYDISVYDSNYPTDNNRKMRVDTANRTFSYSDFGGEHTQKNGGYFDFVLSETIDNAVDSALAKYSNDTSPVATKNSEMTIVVPKNAQIESNGVAIENIPGAYEIILMDGDEERTTAMWSVPQGEYDVSIINSEAGAEAGKTVTFFNEDSAITFETTTDSQLSVHGTSDSDGSLKVDGNNESAFELTVVTNTTTTSPLVISGKGNISAEVANEKLQLTGTAKVKASQGGKITEYALSETVVTVDLAPAYKFDPIPAGNQTATTTLAKVIVNGKTVAFDAYTINQQTYYQIADIALQIAGTPKQFSATWDGEKSAINLTSGKTHSGTMAEKSSGSKTATVTKAKIYLNGTEIPLTAYTINSHTYYRLKDVAQVFDFGVGWDGASSTITIDTSKEYKLD